MTPIIRLETSTPELMEEALLSVGLALPEKGQAETINGYTIMHLPDIFHPHEEEEEPIPLDGCRVNISRGLDAPELPELDHIKVTPKHPKFVVYGE